MKTAKRTVILSDFTGPGGPKSYFLLLADFLINRQKPLRIIIGSPQALTVQEFARFRQAGVNISYLPKFLLSKKKIVRGLRINKLSQFLYLLFTVNGPYEKIIVSTGHSFYFLSGAWKWGRKFFYVQHTYPQGSPSIFTGYLEGFRKFYFSRMAKRGFTFITVSRESKRLIQDFVKLQDNRFPVSVVSNTCAIRLAGPRSYGSKTIVTAGSLERWKNPDLWIEVALSVVKQDDDAVFIWAGTGTMMEHISSRIPDPYKTRIILAGHVDGMSELLSGAAIYFQPSLVESQGMSVVEAMAHALPCVVSNRGGLPEVVDDGITGYVLEPDARQIREKLLYLIHHPDITERMGTAGYEKFEREYSPPVWVKRMDELLFAT